MKQRVGPRSAFVVALALVCAAAPGAQETAPPTRDPSLTPAEAILWTLPPVVLNTVPGFGLGSYLQGDAADAVWLTAVDLLSAGLITVGLIGVNRYPGPDEGGLAALTLLAGYGTLIAGKVAGVAVPIAEHARHGVATDSLLAPIFFNTFPGFGIGSIIQGDDRGATTIAVLDAVALGSIGVLSFAALGGMEVLATVSGVTAYGFYGAARVVGVVRPVVFRRAGTVGAGG